MSRKDDTLYYYGAGMTRLVIEQKLEGLTPQFREALSVDFHYVTRLLEAPPDFQQAAVYLEHAWEILGIKYMVPPPPVKKQKERVADGG